jgi:hypothetical protein
MRLFAKNVSTKEGCGSISSSMNFACLKLVRSPKEMLYIYNSSKENELPSHDL